MSVDWTRERCSLERYEAPDWMSRIPHVPKHRLKIAHLPTPVHRWNLPGVPEGFKMYIKRDDLTGCALSGNKARKMEFILAEAIARDCKHVITSGADSSNHCRATAVAAAEVGLKCHLVLASDIKSTKDVNCMGNMYLNKLSGADLYFVPKDWLAYLGTWPQQDELAERIAEETGEQCHVIPIGGSDTTGLFGYVEAYRELIGQGMLDHVTDIVFSCGSGGTMAGLEVANHLATNSKIGLHAILVGNDIERMHDHCNVELAKLGLNVRSEDMVNCVDSYIGPGYRCTTREDLDFIKSVGKDTGIMLDPGYTGKGARGLVEELKLNPKKFKGKNILFIHTGGLFGGMDHNALMKSMNTEPAGRIHMWPDQVTDSDQKSPPAF